MRSMLLSTALVITALLSSGCATFKCEQGCGVDQVTSANNCCSGPRVGGLLGRLRGEGNCNDCGNGACPDGNCGVAGGMGMGGRRLGSAIGCGPGGNCGIGGSGILAGGFGRAGGACNSCGMVGGQCGCGLGNHAPYTGGFAGPHGPETAHYRYPYYTTRAPRDFLMANPPSIGR